MIRHSAATILVVATIAAAALTQATDLGAASKYDGAWSIVFHTRTGPCEPASRFGGQILNGIIYYSGGSINFSGRVRANGAAWARVSSGSNYAVAYGRLNPGGGVGTWRGRSPSGYCTGAWMATRA